MRGYGNRGGVSRPLPRSIRAKSTRIMSALPPNWCVVPFGNSKSHLKNHPALLRTRLGRYSQRLDNNLSQRDEFHLARRRQPPSKTDDAAGLRHKWPSPKIDALTTD